jgi:hypothetical protein
MSKPAQNNQELKYGLRKGSWATVHKVNQRKRQLERIRQEQENKRWLNRIRGKA